MSSLVFLLCLLCVVRSADLRSSQIKNEDLLEIEDLFNTKDDEWKDKSDLDYDTRESRIPRIWKTVQDMTSHFNPCRLKTKEWKTSEYLKQKQYDFQPDQITVKHCIGSSNDVVKQGCRMVMDCVTQYERRRFIRKPKGTPCSHWHVYEKDIPVGCECMMAT